MIHMRYEDTENGEAHGMNYHGPSKPRYTLILVPMSTLRSRRNATRQVSWIIQPNYFLRKHLPVPRVLHESSLLAKPSNSYLHFSISSGLHWHFDRSWNSSSIHASIQIVNTHHPSRPISTRSRFVDLAHVHVDPHTTCIISMTTCDI